ncbi:MAG: hypothetical protein M0020_02805 [Actinomycetota bacterium]|nr:hypothetical protein [Actinomycetota bacterium]
MAVSFPNPKDGIARHAIGLDRYMWGNDQPHAKGTFPHTTAALKRAFAGADPGDLDEIFAGTPARVHGFDLDKLAADAARVGPLVDEVAKPLDEIPAGVASPALFRD